MDTLNAILNTAANLAFAALGWLSPLGTLLVLSAVFGVLMTIAFRYTSNQKALRRVADRTRANLLAIRLFKDDLGVTIRAQGALLVATGQRLWHSLRPMAFLIVPFFLVLVQLALRYENAAPRVGQAIILSAKVSPAAFDQLARTATLEVPPQLCVEVDRFPDPENLTLEWRLRAEHAVSGVVRLHIGDQLMEKSIEVPRDPSRLSSISVLRPASGDWWNRLLNPAEPALAATSPVQHIAIQVEPRQTPLFGWSIPWWATFLIVSIVVALLVRPFLRVQF